MAEEESDQSIEEMRSDLLQCKSVTYEQVDELLQAYKESCSLAPAVDHGKLGINALQMLEIFSLTLIPKIKDTQHWEIHGEVKTTEWPSGNMEYVYDRPYEEEEPEIILETDSNGALALTISDGCPNYDFFPKVDIDFHLRDRVRDLELVKGSFPLDYKDYDYYDKVRSTIVEGKHASLCVQHATYRAATIAMINVTLIRQKGDLSPSRGQGFYYNGIMKNQNEDDGCSDNVGVSGTILACCRNTGGQNKILPFAEGDDGVHTLFKFSNESQNVTFGKPLGLSRSIVAVPACSELIIQSNLHVAGYGNVVDIAEFLANDRGGVTRVFQGCNSLVYQVLVKWSDSAYHYRSPTVEGTETGKQPKKPKHSVSGKSSSVSNIYSRSYDGALSLEPRLEVFSVFIGCNEDEDGDCSIYGKVGVQDGTDWYCALFDREENYPQKSSFGKVLSLDGPHGQSLTSIPMHMMVDLKSKGHEFCKGHFHLVKRNLAYKEVSWFDKRICTVFQGKQGYAMANYTIFKNAVPVRIAAYITFPSSFMGRANICGKLVAEYDDYEYLTSHEKDFYRSVLFNKPDDSRLQLAQEISASACGSVVDMKGVPIPLSKSVVCVPDMSSLTIEVNLLASPEHGNDQVLSGTIEFDFGRKALWKIKNEDGCMLDIYMDWETAKK